MSIDIFEGLFGIENGLISTCMSIDIVERLFGIENGLITCT